MSHPHVIIGAGQAGGQAVASLRQMGFDGPIALIGEEAYPPYQRPPLSKKFLAGEIGLDRVLLKPLEFYDEAGVTLKLGVRASAIDRAAKTVALSDGTVQPYEKLLIATGSRVRRLAVPGVDLSGVHYLRTIDDVEALRPAFTPGRRLAVVGGGYIGLEVAAVAARHGLRVTVIEVEKRCLARVTTPAMSAFFESVHRAEGVTIRTGTAVAGFEGDGALGAVRLGDGGTLDADLAVIGVGILPNQELAAAAGLAVDNGIIVDKCTRTDDPAIFAAGDCTNHPSAMMGRRVRLESVQNAIDQAKAAAAAMLGQPRPYDDVPWFWSDQYELKLQMAGLSAGYDAAVIRGDPATRQFATFYLKDGVVIGVDAVNAPPEYMIGRKLVSARARVPAETLANQAVSMKDIGREFG